MARVALLLVVAGLTTVGGTSQNPIVVQPAKFAHLPHDWHAFDSDYGFLTHRRASVSSYALSWAYKVRSGGWATQMPRNAIAVSVILIRTYPCINVPGYPPIRSLPLRLPKTTGASQDGQPNIPEYRIFGRIDESYDVDLRVDINNPRPSDAMLREAQSVVSGIHFPTWPGRTRC